MKRNIFYAQSGGVTPVINATAAGLIDYLSKKLATLEYVDGLNNDLSSLKRQAIDFKKLEAFLIKTGMKEGQRNSWLRDIKKLVV